MICLMSDIFDEYYCMLCTKSENTTHSNTTTIYDGRIDKDRFVVNMNIQMAITFPSSLVLYQVNGGR